MARAPKVVVTVEVQGARICQNAMESFLAKMAKQPDHIQKKCVAETKRFFQRLVLSFNDNEIADDLQFNLASYLRSAGAAHLPKKYIHQLVFSDDDSVWSRSFHCVCRSPRISRRAMRSSSSVTRPRFSTTTRHALRKASATRSWARGTALSMLTVTPWMPSAPRRSATSAQVSVAVMATRPARRIAACVAMRGGSAQDESSTELSRS